MLPVAYIQLPLLTVHFQETGSGSFLFAVKPFFLQNNYDTHYALFLQPSSNLSHQCIIHKQLRAKHPL